MKKLLWIGIMTAVLLPGCSNGKKKSDKSLYERLGGTYPICAVVDDFVNRLFADKTILANPHVVEAAGRAVVECRALRA